MKEVCAVGGGWNGEGPEFGGRGDDGRSKKEKKKGRGVSWGFGKIRFKGLDGSFCLIWGLV